MYIPTAFVEQRPQELQRLIVEHPLGVLVTHGEGGLDADHLPFEFDPRQGEHGTLRAHVARANPVWREVASGEPVLVVFSAQEAYISPSWYPSKHESHRQVPTWNYRVVHAHGKMVVRDDEKFVRGVIARLTRAHEASQPVPWKMSDAPKDYIDTMVKAIVGIEIEVTRLVGKSKLSQGAADALRQHDKAVLAQAMLDTIVPPPAL
jgi:transcriptional regulator